MDNKHEVAFTMTTVKASCSDVRLNNKKSLIRVSPQAIPTSWERFDKTTATFFQLEILKVLCFGFQCKSAAFHSEDMQIFETVVTEYDGSRQMVNVPIVALALLPEWRLSRIEGEIIRLLKKSHWDVRSVRIRFNEEFTTLYLIWDVEMPLQGDEKILGGWRIDSQG